MYDDIYRIPMLARVPGRPRGGRAEFVGLTDLTATFLELAGGRGAGRTAAACCRWWAGSAGVAGRVVARVPRAPLPVSTADAPHPTTSSWSIPAVNELYDLVADPGSCGTGSHPELAEVRAS